MEQVLHPLFLLTLPLAAVFSFSYLTVAKAQITPDKSLGAESSVVAPNVQIKGVPSDRIDGGATRGANLFHSFQEFSFIKVFLACFWEVFMIDVANPCCNGVLCLSGWMQW